ncbi:MAG: hypothetical protein FP826_10520 [Sphingomonadales bacterium]|nr:hypothetical protein [Sphingomonadales bacterium]MBU3991655.1 hypothetical protein [Alphaproteobacteria bacterium]
MTSQWRWRVLPALAATLVFSVIAALWLSGRHGAYFAILDLWHIEYYRFPFLDGKFVIDELHCLRAGVDIYADNNPCAEPFDYSPAWALLGRLPASVLTTAAFGFASAALFLGSLVLLPPARDGRGAALIAAGALSTATVFALERANIDVVVFAFTAAGVALLCRGGARRYGGYVLILVAGLLKFFPLAAMAVALRETPGRLLALTAASLLVVCAFAVLTWPDLTRVMASVPPLTPFRRVFGASDISLAVQELGAPRIAGVATMALASALAVGLGLRAGLNAPAEVAIAALRTDERTFLAAGGLIMLGCFFTAQNIDYRAIHLLLALPALAALRTSPAGWRYRALVWMVLWLLWMDSVTSRLFELLGGAGLLVWLLREASWWWFATMLVALLTAHFKDAPVIAFLMRRFSSTPLRAAGS